LLVGNGFDVYSTIRRSNDFNRSHMMFVLPFSKKSVMRQAYIHSEVTFKSSDFHWAFVNYGVVILDTAPFAGNSSVYRTKIIWTTLQNLVGRKYFCYQFQF
jgi:hypothetical protein